MGKTLEGSEEREDSRASVQIFLEMRTREKVQLYNRLAADV